ncbi:MAG: Stk1 family PASTA domain-containing Ser/Thr kinase [Bacilli bacterium]
MIIKGQKINDRYEIIRMIGEGGMANVYLAQDTILDRKVAVKILRGDLAGDEKFVRRFQREAISASSLTHPNIVEMYDVGEDDGKYFIVMEYVDGKTLKSLIKRRGSLTLPEVIDIMMQLTSGLACAHDSYIIHRDIKPQNIMILDDGKVKITDFGIAMALNSNELTQTNSVMGSVHYLPPEQANGNGATIKSDIYSLGILMFELLTGKLPFKGENAVEIAIKQMKEQIPSVCKINPDIPQSVENIILKACAKNPKNRYDNVLEMREDLKTCMDPGKKEVARLVYEYPENDLEETKTIPSLRTTRLEKEEAKEEERDKKTNKKLLYIILGIVAALLLAVIGFFTYTKIQGNKEIKVPDVSDMSVAKAEEKLKEKGFKVANKQEEQASDKIEAGKVIETDPKAGLKRRKGTTITLIVSTGKEKLELEDYTGKNALEIKGSLEAQGFVVNIELKDVDDKKNSEENIIISQEPKAGTEVKEGDTITLYVPNIITEYPDFVSEKWNYNDIQTFCDEYGLTLKVEYEESINYVAGTVIKQSRAAGSKVTQGATITITIAKAPSIVTTPDDDKTGSGNDSNNNSGGSGTGTNTGGTN